MQRENIKLTIIYLLIVGDGSGVTVDIGNKDDFIVDGKIEGVDNALEGSTVATLVSLCSDAVVEEMRPSS